MKYRYRSTNSNTHSHRKTYVVNATDGNYNLAKDRLGFSDASVTIFKRSLKPFFDDINKDKNLSNAHRDEPKMLQKDPSVHQRIREITQKYGHRIWSDDPARRKLLLVKANGDGEYPKDLYWSNEEHRKIILSHMVDMAVGYMQLKRRRDKRRKKPRMPAESVMSVSSQDEDEGVDEEGHEDQDGNEEGAPRVEESDQEDEANGENQDRTEKPSYKIGGRELLT